MSTHTWLITGASRGIGFTLVKLLIADPANIVIAAARSLDSATALRDLQANAKGKLHTIPLDVGDPESIAASVNRVKAILGENGLDYLVNNAGVIDTKEKVWETQTAESLLRTYQVNTVGPALTSQAYLPLLEVPGRRGVIMHISSSMGSLGTEHGTMAPGYAMSKSALNMLTYKQAKARPDLIPFVVCPGWVSTDMGGESAPVKPEDSAAALIKLAKNANKDHAGKFFNRDGSSCPW